MKTFAEIQYKILEQAEVAATLKVRGGSYGGGAENMVADNYAVRRLTPTECARLQGFPDRWGDIEHKDEMTDKEFVFWLEVRQTFDAINGRNRKEYAKETILNWYNKLHTDGNEYKMWGNGVALPCVLYVMEGIAEELSR